MAKLKGSVGPMSMVALLREVRKAERDSKPLAVAGARELVPVLARELRVGGDPLAVLEPTRRGCGQPVARGSRSSR